MYCKNCGKEVNEKAIACISCGFDPKSENKYCSECGAETQEKQIVCIKCGVGLKPKKIESNHKNQFCHSGKKNIAAIIFGSLMLISLFLPWISGKFGGEINALDSKFNQLVGPFGYICLIASLGAIVSLFIRIRYVIYLGLLYLLMIIFSTYQLINLMSNYRIPFEKFLEGGIGFILAIVSVIMFIILTIKELKIYNNNSISTKEPLNYNEFYIKFITSNYFIYGFPGILLLISIFLLTKNVHFPFLGLLFISYPLYFVIRNKISSLFYIMLVLISTSLLNFSSVIFEKLSDVTNLNHSSISWNITNGYFFELHHSLNSAIPFLIYSILIFIVIAIIREYTIIMKNSNIASKLKFTEKGWLFSIIIFIIPLSIFLFINFSKLHRVTDVEKQILLEPLNKLQNEWVILFEKNNSTANRLKFEKPVLNSNEYGDLHISQNVYFNNGDRYFVYLTGNIMDLKVCFPLTYLNSYGQYGEYGFTPLTNAKILIKEYKTDTIKGIFQFTENALNYIAIPTDKYSSSTINDQKFDNKQIGNNFETSENIYKIALTNSYKALETKTFDASNYFSAHIDVYISMKNTTPQKINSYINSSFYKEYQELHYTIASEEFSEEKLNNGEMKITYNEEISCYRKSKQKYQEIITRTEVLFNSENKIHSWKQLKILKNNYIDPGQAY